MDGNRIFITPLAKRIALNNEFDFTTLKGSGPKNRIIKSDIISALEQKPTIPKSKDETLSKENSKTNDIGDIEKQYEDIKYEVIPLTNVRKTIANRLTSSKQTIPHFYLRKKAKIDDLIQLRKQINDKSETKISINDFIVKAVALALKENSDANAVWNTNNILKFQNVDVSVAVSSEKGLMTPIVRNSETKSISSISTNIKEFIHQANEGKLHTKDYTGGSFSISNLGMYNVDSFDAIINPPQSGILAVGGIQKQIALENGSIIENSIIELSAAFDHRVIDGALGAQVVNSIVYYIENPMLCLI